MKVKGKRIEIALLLKLLDAAIHHDSDRNALIPNRTDLLVAARITLRSQHARMRRMRVEMAKAKAKHGRG